MADECAESSMRKKFTEEQNIISEFSIFPNPVSNLINVDGVDIGTLLYITNLVGEIVEIVKVESNLIQLDIRSYKPGIYFINSKSNGNKKFVKL